jgi:hypothetical protein
MNDIEIEKAWSILIDPPNIAGPWVPSKGKLFRYNYISQPLACASSQKEIELEDKRLELLKYLLTDKNRKIPTDWFFEYKESEE